MTMMRKVVPAHVKVLGEDEVEVRMSTATLARDGHILVPQGARLENYKKNPVILWSHDTDNPPVARAEQITIEGEEIVSRVRFAPAGISARADEIRGLVKAEFINGVSVGFDPIDGDPIDPKKPRGGMRFTEWELIECSFCCVPVDPGSVVTARAEGNKEETTEMKDQNDGPKSKRTRAFKGSPLKRGLYDVSNLACMLNQLGWAHDSAKYEAALEGDESPVPAMLGEALVQFGQALIAMTEEEVKELLAEKELDTEEGLSTEERAFIAAGKTPVLRAVRQGLTLARAGRTLSTSNQKKLEDAQGHHERAMKHFRALGEHHEAVSGYGQGIGTAVDKANKAHDDLHGALQSVKKEPEATEHITRALKLHRAVKSAHEDIGTAQADLMDRHSDVGDSHQAMGRSVKSAQRCVRGVVEGSTPDGEDSDSKETQTSSGTDESEGSKEGRAVNPGDLRRRQLDLLALGLQ